MIKWYCMLIARILLHLLGFKQFWQKAAMTMGDNFSGLLNREHLNPSAVKSFTNKQQVIPSCQRPVAFVFSFPELFIPSEWFVGVWGLLGDKNGALDDDRLGLSCSWSSRWRLEKIAAFPQMPPVAEQGHKQLLLLDFWILQTVKSKRLKIIQMLW